MPSRHIEPQIRQQAVEAIRNGRNLDDVAQLFGVSTRSIRRWDRKMQLYGTPNPFVLRTGRPKIISSDVSQALACHIQQYPDAYLDELVEWLAIYQATEISRSALCSHIQDLNLTWKIMRRIAKNRDDAEQAAWFQNFIQTYAPHQTCFLDESSKDGRTLIRKYGRAPPSVTPETLEPLERGDRYTILPAMDMDGYFALRVQKGSVNGQDFADFVLNEVIPRTEAWPGKQSVLVMDNCATHHSDTLREIIEGSGRKLVFLPPYSPDFNPIEESFSCVKAYLRRHYNAFQHSPYPEVELELACYAAVTLDKARGWYIHSGYLPA